MYVRKTNRCFFIGSRDPMAAFCMFYDNDKCDFAIYLL